MKLKILILFFTSISFLGCQKETNTSKLPNAWIGHITMGDTQPELAFYFTKDSVGQTTGHLGIPSKGIPEIPFSSIRITKDSIDIQIAPAQASYKGSWARNRTKINGIWQEGPTTYDLILTPLKTEIDYTNIKKENTSSLPLTLESAYFNFYSEQHDTDVLKKLLEKLEPNYLRITKDMNTHFDSRIDVFIYPNIKAFHKAINYPDAPDWVVGAANKNELKMVSPLHPGSVHTYESLMDAIVHELAHTIVLNYRKQGLVGLPNWLNEGYAYYEANQLTDSQRKIVQTSALSNTILSWDELEKANTAQFGDLNGYPISATIIEFLVDTFGLEKLKQYIIDPQNVENTYAMSKSDLEILWLEYVKKFKF